jgi:hypothetical protein
MINQYLSRGEIMDKRIIAFIALIALIAIMIGGYVISSSNSVESQISDITGSFDFSSEPCRFCWFIPALDTLYLFSKELIILVMTNSYNINKTII